MADLAPSLLTVTVGDQVIRLPRQFHDNGDPKLAAIWAIQLWGQPPPYDTALVPVSLPYYSVLDVDRLRERAGRILPRWQFEMREVHVSAAITREDAALLFQKWGW